MNRSSKVPKGAATHNQTPNTSFRQTWSEAAAALVEAISRCGGLLEQYQVARRPDDEDELPDAPRIRER